MRPILMLAFALCFKQASATTLISKLGVELETVKTSDALAFLVGGRYVHFMSKEFSVGGAVYTGQMSEGASGSFSYGGLTAAYQRGIGKSSLLEFGILAGGGGGFTAAGGVGGGIAFEPTLSVSFSIGHTTRATFKAGYLWLPNNDTFSGITGGIRFDFYNGIKPKPEEEA